MRMRRSRGARSRRITSCDGEKAHRDRQSDRLDMCDTMVTIESIEQLEGKPHCNVFPTDEPKTIRLTLSEGEHVEPHSHPDREIVLYLISGELELRLDEDSHHVQAGDVVHFDGTRDISPSANADSTALLVLARKSEGPDSSA